MSNNVTPVTVALVNDYELVLAGVATMLRPYRDHLVVLDRALERTPDRAVDVSLFDTYGAADDQLDRVKTLADDPMSGAVVVFSFSTAPQLVTAALGAGAGGFVSKTVNGRQLADAIVTVADGHRVVLTPTPHRHRDGALGWPGRGRDLSARDSELLVLLRQGYTNREIAEPPVPQREHGQDAPPPAVPQARRQQPHPGGDGGDRGRGVPAPHRRADAGGSRRGRRLIRRPGPPPVSRAPRMADRPPAIRISGRGAADVLPSTDHGRRMSPGRRSPKASTDGRSDVALAEYERKRDFATTPEPRGRKGRGRAKDRAPGGRFVVQRHRARRLHYDLRLELDGVLVSWAVPQGPTLDASVRRLAVKVEDHPIEYADFEGVIPSGEYGGGDVIVWDRGRWSPEPGVDPAEAIAEGDLHFDVDGREALRALRARADPEGAGAGQGAVAAHPQARRARRARLGSGGAPGVGQVGAHQRRRRPDAGRALAQRPTGRRGRGRRGRRAPRHRRVSSPGRRRRSSTRWPPSAPRDGGRSAATTSP